MTTTPEPDSVPVPLATPAPEPQDEGPTADEHEEVSTAGDAEEGDSDA